MTTFRFALTMLVASAIAVVPSATRAGAELGAAPLPEDTTGLHCVYVLEPVFTNPETGW
jgi:hypothetical protein